MTPAEQITSLYIGYFGRAPDPEGLNYWVGRFNDGFSLAEIAESFSVQAESQTMYPYLSNPEIGSSEAFITRVYLNLFNRLPDNEGLAYWKAQLESGRDVGDFILDVISGAVTNPDKAIIENKIEVGLYFAVEAADEPGFIYDADAANAAFEVINGVDATQASVDAGKAETDTFFNEGPAPTVSALTTAIDNITGTAGADQINGVIDGANGTFNTGDSVNGGTGEDTLSLIVTDSTTIVAANISNVETIRVQALTDANIDLSNASGVETIESRGNNGSFISVYNGTEIVDAVFTNSDNDLGLYYDASAVSGLADVQNVSVNNSVDAFIDAVGVETLAITATGESALGYRQNAIETVTVAGAGDLTLNTTVNVDTFDASAATGDITASFNGGDQTVTGGAGDDSFDFNGSLDEDDAVDGGEGSDEVVLDVGAGVDFSLPADAAGVNAITNVERLTFEGAGGVVINGATFTNTTVANLQFDTSGADTVDNAGSARTYEIGENNSGAITFNMNAASTVLNIDLLGTDGGLAVNDGDDANVDSLTVVLNGAQPTSAVSTINITSNGDLVGGSNNDLGVIDARAGSTVNIDGAASTQIHGAANSIIINASALTGDLDVEGSEATGAVVIDGDETGVDTITLGTGDNVVEFSSALDSGAANGTTGAAVGSLFVDVINGFVAGSDGDVLDFTGTGTDADYTAISAADQTDINLLAGAGANLEAAADIAANVATADEWTAFTFQGQTYALYSANANSDYEAGTDLLVQLTGVTVSSLTDANFA